VSAELRRGTIEARGLTFHTLEAGDGPLVLCLHGFPDNARSFRHQLPALAAAGFRAVAPYMRGYAPTGLAPDGRYQTAALALDAVALIEALGAKDAIVFGHDWGAGAAYGAALAAPERVRKLIAAAVPYGPQFFTAFSTSWAQQKRSWYMFFFQTPFADAALAHDDFAFIERLWADWSPGFTPPREEMAALKQTFRQPGVVEAALGYYRATFNPALQDPALADLQGKQMLAPIDVPTLFLHGANDGCVGVELVDGMEMFFPKGLRKEIVSGAGHFLHQERPDEVNRLVLDFLRE
jgi:pimeloyl-ACP methyl ester carboxylesterase